MRAVVIGCGVIGITTALRLRAAGIPVQVWTREDPLATTSASAGAIWYPFLAEPRQAVLKWSAVTFERLRELASDPRAGVHMCAVVEAFDEEEPDLWWSSAVPGVALLPRDEIPAGFRAAARATVPVCDVPVHLAWLLGELARVGVDVVRREVGALDEAFAHADVVVNCAGLGARELCGDAELRSVRGQVLRLEGVSMDEAWIDDTSSRPRYVIPRAHSLVVGGTVQMDDERPGVDEADSDDILAGAARSWPALQRARIQDVRVGFRPFRSTVRLEAEPRADGRLLVHNYGHGGSGYTVSWGCADDVLSLVTG